MPKVRRQKTGVSINKFCSSKAVTAVIISSGGGDELIVNQINFQALQCCTYHSTALVACEKML